MGKGRNTCPVCGATGLKANDFPHTDRSICDVCNELANWRWVTDSIMPPNVRRGFGKDVPDDELQTYRENRQRWEREWEAHGPLEIGHRVRWRDREGEVVDIKRAYNTNFYWVQYDNGGPVDTKFLGNLFPAQEAT